MNQHYSEKVNTLNAQKRKKKKIISLDKKLSHSESES